MTCRYEGIRATFVGALAFIAGAAAGCGGDAAAPKDAATDGSGGDVSGEAAPAEGGVGGAEVGPEIGLPDVDESDAPPRPMVARSMTKTNGEASFGPAGPGMARKLLVMNRTLNRPMSLATVDAVRQGKGTMMRIAKDEEGVEPTLLWADDADDTAAALDTEKPDLRAVGQAMDIELRPSDFMGVGALGDLTMLLKTGSHMVFMPPPPAGFDPATAQFLAYKAPLDGVYYIVPSDRPPAKALEARSGQARIVPLRGPVKGRFGSSPSMAGKAVGTAVATAPAAARAQPTRAILTSAMEMGGRVRIAFTITDPDGKHEGTLVGIDTTIPNKHLPRAERTVDLPVGLGDHFACVRPVWLGGDKDESLSCIPFTVAAGEGKPDLQVAVALEVGAKPAEGMPVTLELSIKNNGSAPSGPFDIEVTESRDGRAENGDGQVRTLRIESLSAGAMIDRSTPWVPEVSGTRFVVARVDPGDEVAEVNEENNRTYQVTSVAVKAANQRPTIAVAGAPKRVRERTAIALEAAADDMEDGDVGNNVIWRSSRDGVLGTGKELRTSSLSVGRHRIFAEASDNHASAKRTGRAEVEIEVYREVTGNSPPRATAGPKRSMAVMQAAVVRASVRDPDGDAATAVWTLLSKPAGSSATTIFAGDPKVVSVTPDVPGIYELALRATDGSVDDRDRTVLEVAGANQPPVVSLAAVPPGPVKIGTAVMLDGTAVRDPENDALTTSWRLIRPTGSNAQLTGVDGLIPNVTLDVVGSYRVQLTAEDGRGGKTTGEITLVANDGKPKPAYKDLVATMNTVITAGDASLDGVDKDILIDGGTVTIDGSHTYRYVRVGPTGILKHAASTAATTGKMDLTVVHRFEVAAGGQVQLDGLGYLGGNKPGNTGIPGRTTGNLAGVNRRVGGSHGGRGGASTSPASPTTESNPSYGSFRDPADLGGGGGDSAGGGNGGGLLRIKAESVVVDGAIEASGESQNNGGGAGGGVKIEVTESVSGAGRIRANGATACCGNGVGGGGRIAVVGFDPARSNLAALTLEARGATYTTSADDRNGSAGTVFIKSATDPQGTLILDNLDTAPTATTETTLGSMPGALDKVVLRGGARAGLGAVAIAGLDLTGGVLRVDALSITGNLIATDATLETTSITAGSVRLLGTSVLTHPPTGITNPPPGLTVTAARIEVGATARIDVVGRGFLGGNRGANAANAGRTKNNVPGPNIDAGGSHGGLGGASAVPATAATDPAPAYDDYTNPSEPGGGGGSATSGGGNGGGVVKLNATDLVVDGIIDTSGITDGAAGGAGGTIRAVVTGKLSGNGVLRASGGDGGCCGGSGGGGRIAITGFDGAVSTLDGLTLLAAGGGTNITPSGLDYNGGAGTIFIKSASDVGGRLIFDNDGAVTNLHETVIANATPPLAFDRITVRGAANAAVGTATAAAYDLGPGRLEIAALASTSDLVIDGTTVDTATLTAAGRDVHVMRGAVLTHPPSSAVVGSKTSLSITAATLLIDGSSSVDVSGRGYLGGNLPGNTGEPGRTLGNQPGVNRRAGGSHGGRGGAETDPATSGSESSAVYDSLVAPDEPGAGGGSSSTPNNGSGGGLVKITVTNLIVHGGIRADGDPGDSGGGAGGAVRIDITAPGTVTGYGSISAEGGTSCCYGAGGGGRIAIAGHDAAASALDGTLRVSAAGGARNTATAEDRNGSVGTVFLKPAGATSGTLLLDGGDVITRGTDTTLPAGSPTAFDAMVVRGGGSAALGSTTAVSYILGGGRLTVDSIVHSGSLAIHDTTVETSTLTASGAGAVLGLTGNTRIRHPATTLSGAATRSLVVTAATVDLGPQAILDARARGYLGGNVPGNPGGAARTLNNVAVPNRNTGGSHGGRGCADVDPQTAANSSPLTYGSFRQPAGGGGGGGNISGTGANGGGFIHVIASDLIANGVIDADGGDGGNGSGAGGGIRVDLTGALTGTGTIRARGGGTGERAGGGGRIAITGFDKNASVFGSLSLLARGGWYTESVSDYNAGAGTIFLRDASQSQMSGGRLIIDNEGYPTRNVETTVETSSGLTLDRVDIIRGARVCTTGTFTPAPVVDAASTVRQAQTSCN